MTNEFHANNKQTDAIIEMMIWAESKSEYTETEGATSQNAIGSSKHMERAIEYAKKENVPEWVILAVLAYGENWRKYLTTKQGAQLKRLGIFTTAYFQ